ncbi:unnamed protein product [Ambrosiozyma monospora]|uniref:Unnamed protein product n=1 Tax=Ambrosiozyma monospora TaxID=43982 RepID=A0A9W6SW49_AMBMO|nr:unnamed protein product [Ambrosiozyma monospora]
MILVAFDEHKQRSGLQKPLNGEWLTKALTKSNCNEEEPTSMDTERKLDYRELSQYVNWLVNRFSTYSIASPSILTRRSKLLKAIVQNIILDPSISPSLKQTILNLNELSEETQANPQVQTLTNLFDFLRIITQPKNEHYQSMLTVDQKLELYATTLQAFEPTLCVPLHPTQLPPAGMAMASIYRAGKLLYSSTDLRLHPTYEVFYIHALLVYGDMATAIELFESRLKGDLAQSLFWLELGVKIYWKARDFENGLVLLEKINRLFDGYINPNLIQSYARMMLENGQVEEACKWFKKLEKSIAEKGMVPENQMEYINGLDDSQVLWDRFNVMYPVSYREVIRCVMSCFQYGHCEMAADLVECGVNADSGFLKILMDTIDKNLYYLEKETLIYKLRS